MSQAGIAGGGGGGGSNIQTLTGDTGGPVSPDAAHNIDILGGWTTVVDGNPGTNTLVVNPSVHGYPCTPYVVGPLGIAGYQTIQSAINAANAAGGGVVYIMPGSYTENLTLVSGVDLYGTPAVSQNQGASTTVTGTHIPPASGHVGFNSIVFISTTNAFSSVAAGTTHIVFVNCESAIQNGYLLNLPNWSGIIEVFDNNPNTAGAPFAVNDGGLNNTGGATLLVFDAGFGSGTNVMNLSGAIICQGSSFACPVNFQTGSNITMDQHVFYAPVTFSNNSTGNLNTCHFYGGTSPAITMSSSSAVTVTHSVIDSSNNPAIGGAGVGTLTYADLIFLDNTVIENTLTVDTANWRPYATAGNSATAVRGTAGFDSTRFSVTNGFVSLVDFPFNYTNVTNAMSPYTVLPTDYYISVDCSGGTVQLNFSNAPAFKQQWVVKDRTGNAAASNITLTTPGGVVTFDGLTTYTMNSNFQAINLLANATPTYEVY